jgi:hypothetical protein
MSELRLELPYEFDRAGYEQIMHDARHLIAPELGWKPAPDVLPPAPPDGYGQPGSGRVPSAKA